MFCWLFAADHVRHGGRYVSEPKEENIFIEETYDGLDEQVAPYMERTCHGKFAAAPEPDGATHPQSNPASMRQQYWRRAT